MNDVSLRTDEIISKDLETYGNTLYRLAYSYMKNMHDAEDIVQEVFIQLLKNIDIFEKPAYDVILRGMSDIQNGSLKDVVNAISFLMTKCHQYYGKRVMLFIDE